MKHLISLTICLTAVAFTPASNASLIIGPFDSASGSWTLIDNGNFENGLDGWSNSTSPGNFALDSTLFMSSSHSVRSVPNSGFDGPGFALSHSVDITGGETYVLSGFINTRDMATGNLYIDMNDVAFDPNLGSGELSYNTDEWQFLYQSFLPDAGVSSLTVRLVHDSNVPSGESGYFDDIAITPVSSFVAPTVVPEPSISTLMGAGLSLLAINGWRRRRTA